MKKIPMLDMNDPNFADQFAEAIGAKPGQEIHITSSPCERPKGEPAPASPPSDWEALRTMDRGALKEIGLGAWDEKDGKVLMLLPGEWYDHVPEGYELVCINGKEEKFQAGKTDADIRFGCLAYGILVRA